jgi:DNA-binding NarL/FixJ family response regulator
VTPKARIVLCDDHPIVLAGLRNLIAARDDFVVVGVATDGATGLKMIRELQPDIAVVDISMPKLNGIALARRLGDEAPAVKVMVLTLHEDKAFLKQALDAGVRGYLVKRSAAENLVEAARAVLGGGIYVDPAMLDLVAANQSPRRRRAGGQLSIADLTEREADVLKLTALGHTTKEAARQLDVGVKSVETYKARGMEKLGLKTRAEIVRFAAAQGWLNNL